MVSTVPSSFPIKSASGQRRMQPHAANKLQVSCGNTIYCCASQPATSWGAGNTQDGLSSGMLFWFLSECKLGVHLCSVVSASFCIPLSNVEWLAAVVVYLANNSQQQQCKHGGLNRCLHLQHSWRWWLPRIITHFVFWPAQESPLVVIRASVLAQLWFL